MKSPSNTRWAKEEAAWLSSQLSLVHFIGALGLQPVYYYSAERKTAVNHETMPLFPVLDGHPYLFG